MSERGNHAEFEVNRAMLIIATPLVALFGSAIVQALTLIARSFCTGT